MDAQDTPLHAKPVSPGFREFETRWSLWWLLLIVAAASLVYLVAGPSPWDEGLDTSWEAKESLRTHSWVVTGMWYGAAGNLAISILALLAWHFRPAMQEGAALFEEDEVTPAAPGDRLGRALRWGLVGAATLTAGWAMAPRLDLSLWGDEEATARRFIVGNVYRDKDGSGFNLKVPTWQKTIWNWDTGTNNHILFSALARLSHGASELSGAEPGRFYFSERRIRLPSFLATLALIPLAAWVVTRLGFPRGAPVTAFLLALHPWVVRFGSDARGYALLMMLGMLAIACLIEAARRPDRLRWWLGIGLCEWLLLGSNLTSIYLLAPLNAAALWLAWRPVRKARLNPLKVASVWRWAGGGLVGAMLTFQTLMPIALQMPGYLERGRLDGRITGPLLTDSAAYWALGTPWHPWEPGNPLAVTWGVLLDAHPVAVSLVPALLGLLFLAGVVILAFQPGRRGFLWPLLAPIPLLFLDAFRSGHLLYPWYSVGFLPMLFIVVGIGFAAAVPYPSRWPKPVASLFNGAIWAALVALFGIATQPQREILRRHPVEPLANTVRLARGAVVNPFHPRIDETLTLGFVHATRLYDPAMTLAETDDDFVQAIRAAEEKGRPLWVNAANLGIATNYPLASALVADREVFEEPVVVHGLQEPCTRSVFRYKPGGLAKFEAKQTPPAKPPIVD